MQAADCVVNFELPRNPARMYQRIGRVNRIGQKSRCVNVVNLITKNSIEEKILTGIQLKTDLFKGVFEGSTDVVEFSHEKRTEMLNRLREMMGEEPALPPREARPSEDVPEDTPHYLNPKVLKEAEEAVDFTAEEPRMCLTSGRWKKIRWCFMMCRLLKLNHILARVKTNTALPWN